MDDELEDEPTTTIMNQPASLINNYILEEELVDYESSPMKDAGASRYVIMHFL
jgi:hypothetical protein